MLSSMVLILMAATGGTGLDIEALPCSNPVCNWVGTTGPHMNTLDVAVDADANVILCGYFGTGTDLDPTPGVDERTAQGNSWDIFVTKVYADGSYAWSYTVGAADVTDSASGVAVAPDGTIIVTGTFAGTIDFDSGPAIDEHTALGDHAAFVTRLAGDGTYLSTASWTGAGAVSASGIALDRDGNVLITGSFNGWIDFDPGSGVVAELGFSDIFVMKLGYDGLHHWTHAIGSSAFDSGNAVTVDSDGNVYATGTFRGTVDFDPSPGWDAHTMVGLYADLFVSKYYADGAYAWTRTYDASHSTICMGDARVLSAAPDGGCILTGSFTDTVDFDPTEGADLRTAHDDPDEWATGDVFATKLNADGSYGWTYAVGGLSADAGTAVTVGDSGNVFITGYFRESVDFDPGLRVDRHTSEGNIDAFLSKLSSDGTYRWTRTFGGPNTADNSCCLSVDREGDITLFGHYGGAEPYPDYDPGCEVATQVPNIDGSWHTFVSRLVCPALSADFDGDGLVDLRDAAQFQTCFTDEGPTTCGDGCSRLDLDPDDDIDLEDFYQFQAALTGP